MKKWKIVADCLVDFCTLETTVEAETSMDAWFKGLDWARTTKVADEGSIDVVGWYDENGNINTDEIYGFCAGVLTDEIEDFYYDTTFTTFEEACEWGINHDCTHVYDCKNNVYLPIE